VSDDLEQIKRLKARYFRYMDTKRWDDWATVFTADATLENRSARDEIVAGRDAIVAMVSKSLATMITVHHGHMPEIEVSSADSATGVWAMEDYLLSRPEPGQPSFTLHGYGHYYETYRKTEGRWQIATLRLTRLHVEQLQMPVTIGGVGASTAARFDALDE
jgi:hypothetical protein